MALLPEPSERGLARERTALAWNRTGLAAVVCVAVLLRHVWPLHGRTESLVLAIVAAAAFIWVLVPLAFHQPGGHLAGPREIRLITAGTLLLALAGFVLAFVPPT